MDRRTWLTVSTVGTISALSGCVGGWTGRSSTSEDGSEDIEWPELTVETTVGEGELAGVFDFKGSVSQQPTDENPPQINLEVRNEGDEMYEVEIPHPYPWRNYGGEHADEDAEIHLIPYDTEKLYADPDENQPDAWIPEEPTDGCWTAKTEIRPVWPDIAYPTIGLHPGEKKNGTFTVLSSPINEKCFPRGTYKFSDDQLRTDQPEDAELDLSLNISVADPA